MTNITRRTFAKTSLLTLAATAILPKLGWALNTRKNLKFEFIRHATFILEINGKRILVDPMFSPKDALDGLEDAGNNFRIPMVALPFNEDHLQDLLKHVDAVIITHTHFDHFDKLAKEILAKNVQIFCQPTDEKKLTEKLGFTNVKAVETSFDWNGISLFRTEGKHGVGEMGAQMGHVSGFVLKAKDHPAIYIAGDTVWCPDVESALTTHKPDYTVLNTGGAQFLKGGAITMTAEDVKLTAKAMPATKIIAVHMDTINHCIVKRTDLKKFVESNSLAKQVSIPNDGEIINLA